MAGTGVFGLKVTPDPKKEVGHSQSDEDNEQGFDSVD
jgi:hypothetical protein